MYAPVDLCVCDSVSSSPLAGVLVRVFGENGQGVYGEMVTGQDGKASFLLDGPRRYQSRAFQFGTGFRNPLYFDVDPTQSNSFLFPGTTIEVPASTDPRYCLCSGTFRTATGAPSSGLILHFIPKFEPLMVDSSGIVLKRITVVTDKAGWTSVSLLRFGKYDVVIEGYADVTRQIAIPDASSVSLPTLIFELVASITLDRGVPLQVAQGQTLEVYPAVRTTIGRLLDGTAQQDVSWRVEDEDVASLTVQWDRLILYGNTTGATTLTATRVNPAVRIPDPPIFSAASILVV